MTAEDAARLKPYLQLAEQLGSFIGQLAEPGLKHIKIEYEGLVSTLNNKPLTAVILRGILAPQMEGVNMVNAPLVARDRGIEVSATNHERKSDYQTLIRITVASEQRTRMVAGTLFADRARIVEVGGIRLEAGLGGIMLYINNDDKPGLIGGLGTLLGKAGINVANFHLGRDEGRSEAIALVEVDEIIPEPVLRDIEKLPNVRQVRLLSFPA